MIEDAQVALVPAQATAVVHLSVAREEIRRVMGPGLSELRAVLAAQGVAPSGPWFTHHLRMDPAVFDFEIGLPVSEPVTPSGRVRASRLPAGRVARATYRGSYEGLPAAWREFDAWLQVEGLAPAGSLWEVYAVGPEGGPDASAYRTELHRPLAD